MAGRMIQVGWRVGQNGERIPIMVSSEPVSSSPVEENRNDFSSSGLGIGGAGKHEDGPAVPTAAQAERMERRERNARRCRKCGLTSLDGAMFTNAPSSGLCDDCFG